MIEERDIKAEYGLIRKSDGGMEVNDDCWWRGVMGRLAAAMQHVRISYWIMIWSPNTVVNWGNRDCHLHKRDESPSMLVECVGQKSRRQKSSTNKRWNWASEHVITAWAWNIWRDNRASNGSIERESLLQDSWTSHGSSWWGNSRKTL